MPQHPWSYSPLYFLTDPPESGGNMVIFVITAFTFLELLGLYLIISYYYNIPEEIVSKKEIHFTNQIWISILDKLVFYPATVPGLMGR